MGRGKLKMELIEKEKSRHTTFQKRKKGLKKKTYEFSTLCGVDACMIIFGPKQGDCPVEPEIWPEDLEEVRRIIRRFKEHSKEEREKRSMGLSNFFEDRKKKIEDELSKFQQQNDVTKYSNWDNCIDDFSEDELKNLACSLDFKLEVMNSRINLIKEKQRFIEEREPSTNWNSHFMYQRNSVMDDTLQQQQVQPLSCLKPLDQHLPMDYPYNSNLVFEPSTSIMNPITPMNSVSGGSSSLLPYPHSMDLMAYPTSTAFDSGPSAYYLPLNMQQPMPPYAPYSMPGLTPQMHSHHHHVEGFFDFQDYKHKRAMSSYDHHLQGGDVF